jgi:NAD+ synthase (glutamine-hydrolysing)
MRHGFIKVAAATPMVKVADCVNNAERIIELINEAISNQVRLIVFPELSISAYTCGDLFLQNILLSAAKRELLRIARETQGMNIVAIVGLPIMKLGNLYNVAAVLFDGKVLGIVPKLNIPNYSEFYEARHFTRGNEKIEYIDLDGVKVPFGCNLLFRCKNMEDFIVGVEICEDIWVPIPPSSRHALAGATVIANLSASNETTGKDIYRRDLVSGQSARIMGAYIYASAGEGESTSDVVFSGHNIIAENGTILKESERFKNQLNITELDIEKVISERRRMSTFNTMSDNDYTIIDFEYDFKTEANAIPETLLTRWIDKAPFVPSGKQQRDKRCEEILNIQAMGLKKRLLHTNCKSAVVGISGGLDSTLALLVMVKAYDMLGIDRKNIVAVTMPCFGTTDRTYNNAVTLTKQLGATLREVNIREAVLIHLRDIGHDVNVHDVTYENAQARERTQILMNIANEVNGLVIGTGDLSELALGWATYNGDHMSMYGVNCSVPKTLVRYLVSYYAETVTDSKLREVLLDVLDTPVSPELLPPEDGKISQKTEDLVGPYELHDFFLYYIMRFGFVPTKVFRLAEIAFDGAYDSKTIYKWLSTFYRRFFSQQFKRNCLPDGPKVGSVAVSPRGDLRMPSDASSILWIKELEELKEKYGVN